MNTQFTRWITCVSAALAFGLWIPIVQAGCIDGGCGRIDWTEITEQNDTGDALSAKLHGAFAWESSDGWSDGHPVAGSLIGFIHLSYLSRKIAIPSFLDTNTKN